MVMSGGAMCLWFDTSSLSRFTGHINSSKCAWILKAGNRQLVQLLPTLNMYRYYAEHVRWIQIFKGNTLDNFMESDESLYCFNVANIRS